MSSAQYGSRALDQRLCAFTEEVLRLSWDRTELFWRDIPNVALGTKPRKGFNDREVSDTEWLQGIES